MRRLRRLWRLIFWQLIFWQRARFRRQRLELQLARVCGDLVRQRAERLEQRIAWHQASNAALVKQAELDRRQIAELKRDCGRLIDLAASASFRAHRLARRLGQADQGDWIFDLVTTKGGAKP